MTTHEALEHEFMMAFSPSGSYGLSLTGLDDAIASSDDLSSLLKSTDIGLKDAGWSGMLPGESGQLSDFKISKMYSTSVCPSGVILEFQPGLSGGALPWEYENYGDDCTTYLVICEECGATFAKLKEEDFVLCRECDKKPKKYTSQSSHERRIILD